MTRNYKLINNVLGWIVGILATMVYVMTAEPTASWWDCGEYIATAYKLQVGHPPGAPTFQLIGRFFAMFAGNDVTKVALCINVMSAICSGLTIMFLFWTITQLGKKLVAKMGKMDTGRMIAIFGSALVGALTYTFTDTFWFSAVEGEVYAMSSFFTALVFWCILKWDEEYDNQKENVNPHRWIILIVYLVGLSIGVHLLNLLTLPAIILVIYFKLSKKATIMGVVQALGIISFFAAFLFPILSMFLIWIFITIPLLYLCIKKQTIRSKAEWGVFLSLIGSLALLGLILYGIIPGIVSFAGKFEIFFVNSIGLPFYSGTIIYFLLIIGLLIWGFLYSTKKGKNIFQAVILSFVFLLIGYSTFLILVIRSNENPPIDENNPEDAVALLAYLNREQYGSNPLIYGQYYNSQLLKNSDGNPVYVRDTIAKKYVISDNKKETVRKYKPSDCTFFPRMWDDQRAQQYIDWLKNQYNTSSPSDKENRKHLDKGAIPTYQQNIKFLQSYQLNYMYFRYFMWNFSGRQNDIQGHGDNFCGNWITGIPFIDNYLVGNQTDLPPSMERPGQNKYYLLPLLLGLIGVVFYSIKDGKNSFIVLLLFAMTGLAIAFYLNMYAFQPRERDYAFAASFYAFSIWIGFGVFGLYSLFDKMKQNAVKIGAALGISIICLGLVPGIMASENWDDHNRAHRYTALAFAKAYLDSCAPNAILFTLGDNDTFPLWYAQEVEGYRTDVRVCNLSLLNTAWYIDQMRRKAYLSEPLPISMEWNQYKDGTRDMIALSPAGDQFINMKDIMNYINSSEFDNKRTLYLLPPNYRTDGNAVPASFSIPVDKEKVLKNGTVQPGMDSLIVDRITWNLKADSPNQVIKATLIQMDILANNNWDRPIYFAITAGPEAYLGLEDYFQIDGFAYRLVPIKTIRKNGYEVGRIRSDVLYNNLMNVFNDHSRIDKVNNPNAPVKTPYPYLWGGINDPRVYNNEDNIRLVSSVRSLYLRLAEQLIAEGKIIEAEKVLDQGNKVLPDERIPYKLNSQQFTLNYSLFNFRYAMSYFSLGTKSGIKKGNEMLGKIITHFVKDFAWFQKLNDRSLNIQYENIMNDFILLDHLLTQFSSEQITPLKNKLKEIQLEKTSGFVIETINKNIGSTLKRVTDNQSEIARSFQELKLIASCAQAIGNVNIATKATKAIEFQLSELDKMDPNIGAAFREFLSR